MQAGDIRKDYTDSDGISVQGVHGTDRYWIRKCSNGACIIMSKVVVYDAFDYRRPDGLSSRIGVVGSFGTYEQIKVKFYKLIAKKQAAK